MLPPAPPWAAAFLTAAGAIHQGPSDHSHSILIGDVVMINAYINNALSRDVGIIISFISCF